MDKVGSLLLRIELSLLRATLFENKNQESGSKMVAEEEKQ